MKKMSKAEALEIIGQMADSAADCSGDDPEDKEMAKKADALSLAYDALKGSKP
jgi:hypothetical protein